MGSSSVLVSFVVPSHPPGLRIPGLNVYCVYTRSNIDEIGHPNLLFTKIYNKTKDLKWIYTPVAIAIPGEENEEEEFVWLSHWKFGNHLESGDEVDILVITSGGLEVKEFGISLVWGGEEEEDTKANTHHHNNMEEIIGGDLSNYQFMSPQTFVLCHHYMLPFFTKTATIKSWFQQLVGPHVTYEVSNFGLSALPKQLNNGLLHTVCETPASCKQDSDLANCEQDSTKTKSICYKVYKVDRLIRSKQMMFPLPRERIPQFDLNSATLDNDWFMASPSA
ncbi:hypothetical protein LguiB_006549 [Lonicera macranthoides]